MTKYPFMQVDAFSDKPLQGNPCAIVLDSGNLEDDRMLAIAKEMNLSETAFVSDSKVADFAIRFFTPAEEIPLAGHPTIASVYALIKNGYLPIEENLTTIFLELKAGVINVEIQSKAGDIELITMEQNKPQFLMEYSADEICPIFGIDKEDINLDVPIQTVSTGTPQLMITLKSLDSLRNARLDFQKYEVFRGRSDFFSPHLFVQEGIDKEGDTFARHFGTPPDTIEDPFTGSATGGMAAFLWHYGLLEKPAFIAQQGHWMGRPGKAKVEVVGPRNNISTVRVGGQAAQIITGILELA